MAERQVEEFIDTQKTEGADDDFRPSLSPLKLIPHFLSQKECAFFRELACSNSKHRVEQLASRKRLIFDSQPLAAFFWSRLNQHYPFSVHIDEFGDKWRATGANTRFRLVRYDANDKFDTHEDGFWLESWKSRSFATAMVYLNDVPEEYGGATRFHDLCVRVQPIQGMLVTFLVDDLAHCGETLLGGEKYLLRTDVMYTLCLENLSQDRLGLRKNAYNFSQQAQEAEEGGDGKKASFLWKQHFDALNALRCDD